MSLAEIIEAIIKAAGLVLAFLTYKTKKK